MNNINRLSQSAYLLQGNLLPLTGGGNLECALERIGYACQWDVFGSRVD